MVLETKRRLKNGELTINIKGQLTNMGKLSVLKGFFSSNMYGRLNSTLKIHEKV